jgi:hypothetical protein
MGDITTLFTYINQPNHKRKCVKTASIRKQGQKSQATTGLIAGNEGNRVRFLTTNNYRALWI